MKKVGLFVASLITAGTVAMAANPVYSVNAVGFVKKSVSANSWYLVGLPFAKVGGGAAPVKIGDILGTTGIPDSTTAYIWDGTQYLLETFIEGYGWDPGTVDLSRSDGFWLNSTAVTNLVMSGEVPGATYASNTVTALSHGFQMVAYPYPISISVTNTSIGAAASDSDVIYIWNGSGYDLETYIEGYGWDPGALVMQPGAGYWYYRNSAGTSLWTENKPYNWP